MLLDDGLKWLKHCTSVVPVTRSLKLPLVSKNPISPALFANTVALCVVSVEKSIPAPELFPCTVIPFDLVYKELTDAIKSS